jgi:hypothetical protein
VSSFACRDCDQSVSWAVTQNGKRVLLDETPAPEGNVAHMLAVGESGLELAVTLHDDALKLAQKAGVQLRTVHFITCKARPPR